MFLYVTHRLVPLIVSLTLLALFLPVPSSAQNEDLSEYQATLKSASELDYPPFSVVRPDGTADGFSVELLKAAAAAAGFDISFKVGPWSELKEELAAGVLDVLPLVSYSAEREKFYDFTTPYLQMNGAIFVRKGNATIRKLSDLMGKEVLVMRGDTAHEYVVKENLTDKIIPTTSYDEAFRLLDAGKHDAVVVQQIVGLEIIKKLGIKNIIPVQQKIISTLRPVTLKLAGFEQKFCFAVRKGNHDLQSRLNEGLTVVYLNGTYNKLYEKWFAPILPEPRISAAEVFKKFLVILVPLLLIFALFGVWFFKRLAAKRTRVLELEIKQRKLIEEKLLASNIKYSQAQQIGRVGNWDYDVNTQEFTGSAEAKRIYGFADESLSFTTEEVESCIPEKERVHRALIDLIEKDIPYNLEYDIITKNSKKRRTIIARAELEKGPSKNPVKVHGVIHDITERKLAEERLTESESLFRTLVKTIPDLIWLKDTNGVFIACNPMFEDFYGAREADIIGKTDYSFVDKELADFFIKNDRKAMATGKPSSNEEWLTFAKDGHRALYETIKTPLHDNDGTIIGVLGVARDISERKRAEEERVRLEAQLLQAQKLEAIGVLAGGIAHDFNNILSSILGFTELARNSNPSDQQLQEDLNEIYTAGNRAKDLVQRIFTFSRQQKHSPVLLDVQEIVEEALKLLHPILPASINIQVTINEGIGLIRAELDKMNQIIMNLCTNASQAMEDRGGILAITISETKLSDEFFINHPKLARGDYVKLVFQDTGTGIAPEILGSVFDPYFTTKNYGDGTGLGLSATYGIIQEMNGDITIESKLGTGSTVTVLLPVAVREEGDANTSDSQDNSLPMVNERILLVDDEPQILKFTTRILENSGYAVTTAGEGQSAFEIFKRNPLAFDLIISDVTMPKVSGNKLALQILGIVPTMPIILASGYSKSITEKSVLQNGVKGFLKKPISKEQLLKKVRQVLDQT